MKCLKRLFSITLMPLFLLSCNSILNDPTHNVEPVDRAITDHWYNISDPNSVEIVNQLKLNIEHSKYDLFDSLLVRTNTNNSRIAVIPLFDKVNNVPLSWFYFRDDTKSVDFFMTIESAPDFEINKDKLQENNFEEWTGNIRIWGG
jgi:hypothetical protein